MIRLTFVGDISLDKPLLKAAKERGKGSYDFSSIFHTQDVFSDSTLVVGNLETVFGGGRRFNKKPYHYNSPDSFCQAIKDAGIKLVSTANNHCMDEGVAGLRRTLRVLDDAGIAHTGTNEGGADKRYLVQEINGVRIAFYSLTCKVNIAMETLNCDDLYRYVNLIGFTGKKLPWMKQYYRYVAKRKLDQIKKRIRHISTVAVHKDSFSEDKINKNWMADIEHQIKKAKEDADLLVVLLHSYGQFNEEPGTYVTYVANKLSEFGADIIVGNHPHTAQRIEQRDGKLIAFSLGGYCMSVSGEYVVHECLPEYSLALHVDIDEKKNTFGYSIDVLKGTEDARGYLTVAKAEDEDSGVKAIKARCFS